MSLWVGLRTKKWILKLGFDESYFSWRPGEIESGSSYPSEHLDGPYGDHYVVWGWLGFIVFWVAQGSGK